MDMVSRFTSIDIKGLFGDRDETIDFPDLDDPIRILYGVNGSGKTTILKIIQNTYRWNPLELIKLPFDSITFNKNTRRKFNQETYFDGLGYYLSNHNRNINLRKRTSDELFDEISTKWQSKSSNEIFKHLNKEVKKLNGKWITTQKQNADAKSELSQTYMRTKASSLHRHLPDEVRRRQSLEHEIEHERMEILRQVISNLDSKEPIMIADAANLMVISGIFFVKKLHELNEGYDEKSLGSYHNWGDDVQIRFERPSTGVNYSVSDIDIRIDREFGYNTSLKVEKIENPRQYLSSFDLDKTIEENVGCLLKITETHKPRLEFKNKQIERMLKTLDDLNKISPKNNYNFSELFAGVDSTYIIRMPDLYDYWDLDWERIEQNLTGYDIKRSVTGKNIHNSNLDKDFEIRKPDIGRINVHDFLRSHLPYELITHAKVREVKDVAIDKHYSKINRPPPSIVDFFEYEKTAISFDNYGNIDSEYIHLPRVIDISTEREIGPEYFWRVKRYVNNENRVLLRSISDFKDKKLEHYKKLNSSHIEMVQTRLKERGIDFSKFREQPMKFPGKARGSRYAATIVYNEIIKSISNVKKQSGDERMTSRMNYFLSDLVPPSDSARDNDYTVDGLDLRP